MNKEETLEIQNPRFIIVCLNIKYFIHLFSVLIIFNIFL